MEKKGLYIHIPFCDKRCDYCAFVSSVKGEEEKEKYINNLINEVHIAKNQTEGIVFDTVYIGGGTPSCLSKNLLKKLINCIRNNFHIEQEEFTVEGNPNSLSEDKLKLFKLLGVDRISIGVQSFNDKILNDIGRLHDSKQAVDCLNTAIRLGFKVSADGILGLQGQGKEDISHFVKTVSDIGVEHISLYSLTVEENTPLFHKVQTGKYIPSTDDEEREYYDFARSELSKYGYERYEVSSFCKNNQRSLHNQKYWSGVDYYGFGISARGLVEGVRYRVSDSFEEYYKMLSLGELPHFQEEILSDDDKIFEMIMLGLRTEQGIDCDRMCREFNIDFKSKYKDAIEKVKNYTLFKGNYFCVKEDCFYLMNSIILPFMI